MGFIKTIFWLVIIVAIIAVGGFAYLTVSYPSANDKLNNVWASVTKTLPAPARKWACDKAKSNPGATGPIEACENI
jgi:hypothetical protein